MTGPGRPSFEVPPRHARRRGTRGFAAVVTGLVGAIVLAVGAVVLPASSLSSGLLAWLIPSTVVLGLAHFLAVAGLILGRSWSGSLVAGLAAVGIGAMAFLTLVLVAGPDPLVAPGHGVGASPADGIGLFAWMTGLWAVAGRAAGKGVAFPAIGTRTVSTGISSAA